MNQEKILLQIETELADLKSFVRKLKPDARLHQLDIDLLKQKIRNIYDTAMFLESAPEAVLKANVSDIKKPQPETEEEFFDDSFQKEKRWNESKQDVLKAEDLVTEPQDENVKDNPGAPSVDDKLDEKVVEAGEKTEEENTLTQPVEAHPEEVKNETVDQPDLFSTSETVADKFTEKATPTVAEKLTQKSLESLKQLIGINEKFLFVNELFKGDLRSYNNALNELDSLKTLEGANTYLFELKVQNQWADDLEAYLKLKELIEKKFVE